MSSKLGPMLRILMTRSVYRISKIAGDVAPREVKTRDADME